MKTNPKKKKPVQGWTLEDAVHFVIYRELDKLRVPFPYEKATRICDELRAAVEYRSPSKNKKLPV
jgi:hypothetical protein